MAIPDEDIAKVRAATDIAGLIGEHTALKRSGRRLVGLCPFHSEKSPSFSVNPEEGLYYCFGCQASGDAISFVRRIEGCDFVEAVERLAARAGVTIRNDADPADAANRNQRLALYEAMEKAAAYYHDVLIADPRAGRARHYLRSRGYDGEVVRQFRIGFAPEGYDGLVRALPLPKRIFLEAGLAFENRRGSMQDVFRERIIFPIADPGGRTIALGGRVLPEEIRTSRQQQVGPKYRNSPESAIYQKRGTLYGLNWAKGDITRTNEVIVCEGYTDVIGFFQAGLPRAVATCGTALTEDHFRLLSRFARRIVLCFDADNAGQNAAARLYEWERRHELELAVAALPPGSDPAELAGSDPGALRDAVEHAAPFLGFRIGRAIARFDLAIPEGRARAAEAAVLAVAEHPNEFVRDEYLVTVADQTHLDPDRLRALLETSRRDLERAERNPAPTRSDEPPPRDEPEFAEDDDAPVVRRDVARGERPGPAARAGEDALILAIRRPAEVAEWLDEVLFTDPLQRETFLALCNAAELHQAIEEARPEVGDLIRRLATSADADQLEVAGTYLELVRRATEAALREIEADARRAQRNDEGAEQNETRDLVPRIKGELELLRDPVLDPGRPSAAIEAAGRLLAWLRQVQREG